MTQRGLAICSSHDGRHEYPGVLPVDMQLYGACVVEDDRTVQWEGGWPLRTLDRYSARGGKFVPSLGGGSVRSHHPYVQGIIEARLAGALVDRINLGTDKIAVFLPGQHHASAGYAVVHVSDPRRERGALNPRGGLYGDITHALCDIVGW